MTGRRGTDVTDELGAATGRAATGPGAVVLLTGLPSAGKSTLARALRDRLAADGRAVEVLDGDDLRRRLPPAIGFSTADREAQGERARFVAELLSRHGVSTIVALVAPFRRTRAAFREAFGERYLEVYLRAPLEACVARDSQDVYRRARERGDAAYESIVGPYEPPNAADVVLETARSDVDTCASAVVAALRERELLA